MRRFLAIALALWIGGAWIASDATAHGGSFRGPNGGVPPGLRESSDPEPPPPPPTTPGTPGAPETPGPDGGPGTPPDHNPGTPGGNGPPPTAPINPLGPGIAPAATSSTSFESWRFWWAYNSDDILNLKSHLYARRPATSSPLHFASKDDETNVMAVDRPTRALIQRVIEPALVRTLHRRGDHEDIHGGALVALGKIGAAQEIARFRDALHGAIRTDRGQKIELGYQARESGALALGLLPHLDEQQRAIVRRICLEAVADESLRTRERTWAAVSLGFQRDREAVEPLWELLARKYANDDVPCGILAGLALIGDDRIRARLTEAIKSDRLNGREMTGPMRSFVVHALGRVGDAESLELVLKILKSRRFGRLMTRSAAIAAGVLGAQAEASLQERTVRALQRLGRKGGDPTTSNFALIALSQIGTEPALRFLLEVAENGKYGQRPFAALGLGTRVWYGEHGRAAPVDPDLRATITAKLDKLSQKFKDTDTRAAFFLARGLVADESAIPGLVRVAARNGTDPLLRGFACVSLGLIGQARPEVKEALHVALAERRSADLRRDAATGLGLLRDAEAVPLLLAELEKAKSFAVQGQIITAVGTIGDHRAIEPLVRILDDTRQPEQTRAMAAVGLGMIGDLLEIPKLARLSKNYNYRASVPDLDELLYIL